MGVPARLDQGRWRAHLQWAEHVRVLGRRARKVGMGEKPSYRSVDGEGVSIGVVPDVRQSARAFVKGQRALADIVKKEVESADAVMARLPSEAGLAAVRNARRLGRPWAVEVAGCAWDSFWNYGNIAGKMYAPIMWYRVRHVVRDAPFVLYVTECFLQKRYPCRSRCTAACSDVDVDSASKEVLERRVRGLQEGGEGDQELVFGLIGSLHGRFKGIQTVLDALGRIRDELPAFRFRVLGGGDPAPWRELAGRYGVADVTLFDGTLPAGRPVLDWLDGIDVYLQPSLREGLPRALLEAMSRGCPAIGTRVAGIPELLEPEALVPRGDAGALSRLMVRAAHDAGWRRRQAVRNWEKAREYSRDVLEPRRQAFWGRFAEYARARSRG